MKLILWYLQPYVKNVSNIYVLKLLDTDYGSTKKKRWSVFSQKFGLPISKPLAIEQLETFWECTNSAEMRQELSTEAGNWPRRANWCKKYLHFLFEISYYGKLQQGKLKTLHCNRTITVDIYVFRFLPQVDWYPSLTRYWQPWETL